jgi:hypothetical protein
VQKSPTLDHLTAASDTENPRIRFVLGLQPLHNTGDGVGCVQSKVECRLQGKTEETRGFAKRSLHNIPFVSFEPNIFRGNQNTVEEMRGSCYTRRKMTNSKYYFRKAETKRQFENTKSRWKANIEMDDTGVTADDDKNIGC